MQNLVELVEYLFVPEPDHTYSKSAKFCSPVQVLFVCFRLVMNPSVNFDDQSFFMTVKITNISVNRVLPPEFQPLEFPVFQFIPQDLFSFCHAIPQNAGLFKYPFCSVQMKQILPALTDINHLIKIQKSDNSFSPSP